MSLQFDIKYSLKKRFIKYKLIQIIEKSLMLKGLLIIASGNMIAQLIGIVSAPILTRIYSPSDLGVLALYISSLSIIVVIASLRYESALPLPKSDSKAANLFLLSAFLLIINSIVFSVILIANLDNIVSLFHLERIKTYYIYIMFGFIGAGAYRILNYWATRKRDYTRITHTKINQGIGGASVKILLGLASFGPLGLIIGQFISEVVGSGTLAKNMWNNDREAFRALSYKEILNVADEYKNFPIFSLPAALLNTLSLQLPVLLISSLFGSYAVGLYSLAYGTMVMPTHLISTAMSQVFYAEISDRMRNEKAGLKFFYVSIIKKLFIVGLILVPIPTILAPIAFPIIFGEAWREAGLYCIPLSMVVLSGFVVSPTSNLGGYGFNHIQLFWDALRVILISAGFYISYLLNFTVIQTLYINGLIMVLCYVLLVYLNLRSISLLDSRGIIDGQKKH